MLVSCPQCKAKYELATAIKNAILVCHRCGIEFHTDQPEEAMLPIDQEVSLFEYTEPSIEETEENHADTTLDDIAHMPLSEENLLPERGQTHLWHWLILVLLCISSLGIWNNQQQWLRQPWVRSLMINMQLPVASNPADWTILKDHIHSQWVDRQDHSRVLFIDGYIQNQLLSPQIPPAIQISFFDMPNSRAIQTQTIAITEPPSLPVIRHTPYIAPAIDQIPVRAGGKRAFTFVIEHVPEQARELSMVIASPES